MQESFDDGSEHYVNWIASAAVPNAFQLTDIEEQSETDETTKALKAAVYEGKWNKELAPYKVFETELCFAGNILMRGTQIIVPENLRLHVLELAHEGHPGMTVMKRRARAKVWWPRIDQHVEEFVKKCRGCILVAAPSAPEPLKRRELPSEPWQHIALDFLGPLPTSHNLFVIIDCYSPFLEIEIMKKIDSTEAIKRLRNIFARFGLPLTITADNGRQLFSDEFKAFCESNNIKLITTTPYWPQQNGEVERQNRSILKRLVIAHQTGKNWREELNDFLFMYRATPHSTTLKTPARR